MRRSPPICPSCGQEIYLPVEFKGLQLRPMEVKALCTLVRAKGRPVEWRKLGTSLTAARTYIWRIREALADIGSNWIIVNDYAFGVALKELKSVDEGE